MHFHYFWVMFQKNVQLMILKRMDYMDLSISVDYDTVDVDDNLYIHKYIMKMYQGVTKV